MARTGLSLAGAPERARLTIQAKDTLSTDIENVDLAEAIITTAVTLTTPLLISALLSRAVITTGVTLDTPFLED